MAKISRELGEHNNHRIVIGDKLGKWYPKGATAFFHNGDEMIVHLPIHRTQVKFYKLVEVSETELQLSKE